LKKSSGHLLAKPALRYQFIEEHRQEYPVSLLSEALDVEVAWIRRLAEAPGESAQSRRWSTGRESEGGFPDQSLCHKISPFSRIISPSQTERTSKTGSFSRITFPPAFPLTKHQILTLFFLRFGSTEKNFRRKTKSYARSSYSLCNVRVYSERVELRLVMRRVLVSPELADVGHG